MSNPKFWHRCLKSVGLSLGSHIIFEAPNPRSEKEMNIGKFFGRPKYTLGLQRGARQNFEQKLSGAQRIMEKLTASTRPTDWAEIESQQTNETYRDVQT